MSFMPWIALSLPAVVALACSSASDDSAPLAGHTFESIPGFIQTLATTRCSLGSGVHEIKLPGDTEWIGSEGVFDIDLSNDSAICETNPYRSLKGPTADVEIAEVKAYFVGAGLPSSQIGAITPTYEQDASGEQYVNAKINRVVGHIPVADSVAWAGLVGGQSLGEGVFWPELPASVSEELAQLQSIVADPKSLAAFQARLPRGFVSGSIVIHHVNVDQRVAGDPAAKVPLLAHACYDVLVASGELGMTDCYLADGTKFVYPEY